MKTRYHCLRNRLKKYFYEKINDYMEIIEDYSSFQTELNSQLQKGQQALRWDDWQKDKTRPLSALVHPNLASQKKLEWNSQIEQEYRQKRENSRLTVRHFSRLNRYDAVAIMPLINQLHRHELCQQKRLLQKYRERDHISQEELQFITQTSNLLNQCL